MKMTLNKYTGNWSAKEARHLMNRAGFGGTSRFDADSEAVLGRRFQKLRLI